jgi:hypothetical protein
MVVVLAGLVVVVLRLLVLPVFGCLTRWFVRRSWSLVLLLLLVEVWPSTRTKVLPVRRLSPSPEELERAPALSTASPPSVPRVAALHDRLPAAKDRRLRQADPGRSPRADTDA